MLSFRTRSVSLSSLACAPAAALLMLFPPEVAADPYVDNGFTPTTARPDADLVIVREAYYGAGGVDLSAYGFPGSNTHVQSIYFRLFVDNDAASIDSFTGLVVFPPQVTIVGFITDGTPLGGDIDDGLWTESDAVFGIGGDPDLYSESARGFEAGGGTSHSEFIGQISAQAFTFGLNVSDGVDDFRVIIDYGDSLGADLSFDLLAFEVGELGGAVPVLGIRVGNDSSPSVFGSGDFGETAGLLDIPLTSTTAPTPTSAVPFDPTASLFILRDVGSTSTVDGYDTAYDVPLPDLFPITTHVASPAGVTDGNDGLLYAVGQGGGLAVINPVTSTVQSTLLTDLPGNSVAVTNLDGTFSLFIARDTSGDTEIDVLDPGSQSVTTSFSITGAASPVDIADGPDGLLYVLGLGGGLVSVAPDGSNPTSRLLNPPSGSYAGLTSRAGSRLLYLVRDTAGDTNIDTYDVDTEAVTFGLSTFPSPGAPIGITDGPDDHLYVIGAGNGGATGYAEVDPDSGGVLLAHQFMDFTGFNVAVTSLDALTVVAAGDMPAPEPAPSIMGRAVPNPFSPGTRIEFDLPQASPVRVTVHDVAGRLVRELASGERFDAGPHAVAWDGTSDTGSRVQAGVYYYRIAASTGSAAGKLVLIR